MKIALTSIAVVFFVLSGLLAALLTTYDFHDVQQLDDVRAKAVADMQKKLRLDAREAKRMFDESAAMNTPEGEEIRRAYLVREQLRHAGMAFVGVPLLALAAIVSLFIRKRSLIFCVISLLSVLAIIVIFLHPNESVGGQGAIAVAVLAGVGSLLGTIVALLESRKGAEAQRS